MSNNPYDSIFSGIARSKPTSSFLPRLEDGVHQLILTRFKPKDSKQKMGTILEADFTVVASSKYVAGDRKGQPFFIGQSGWAGAYEQDRAKKFMNCVALSLGRAPLPMPETREPTPEEEAIIQAFGAELCSGKFNGIIVQASVTKKMENGQPVLDKKGKQTYDVEWSVVSNQQNDQTMREALATIGMTPTVAAPSAPVQAPPVQAPVQQQTVAAPTIPTSSPTGNSQGGALGGLLAGLKKQG